MKFWDLLDNTHEVYHRKFEGLTVGFTGPLLSLLGSLEAFVVPLEAIPEFLEVLSTPLATLLDHIKDIMAHTGFTGTSIFKKYVLCL